MSRAWVVLKPQPWYRKEAFCKGLAAAGYEVLERSPDRGRPGDLLVQWNRYSSNAAIASRFESEGGRVLIAENGYLNADGSAPKFSVHPGGPKPSDHYAIGIGFHNDAERVLPGGPERWAKLGIELKPWRTDGEHILVAPNRSFGVPERTMHPDWAQRTAAALAKQTRRQVRIREHPGNNAPRRALSEDLKNCWAVFVWSSSVAVHALAAGIPTYIEAPFQILKGASASGPVDAPVMPERLPHFERMACGQFTCAELESGEPFRGLRA